MPCVIGCVCLQRSICNYPVIDSREGSPVSLVDISFRRDRVTEKGEHQKGCNSCGVLMLFRDQECAGAGVGMDTFLSAPKN
jgi:hypothetical protein